MKLFEINKSNYEIFKEHEYFYTDNSNNLYFKSFHTGKFELVKDADLKTITFLTNTYFYDKERIYHESKCLKKGYSSFKDYESYGYFKIDNVLYWFGKKIKTDFNGDLFNITEHFFTDSEHLFVNGKVFDFDKNTFSALNKFYAKDSSIVFHSDKLIKSADSETFRVIREDSGYSQDLLSKYSFLVDDGYSAWACDKNNLYFCGETFLSGVIDPLTTRIINMHIVIDKNNVFYHKKHVKDADPDTFECIFDSSKINDEYKEIKFFTSFYKDKDNLFYLYEHETSESKNEIIKCTRRNRDKFIDNLKTMTGKLDIYNLTEVDIERINELLQD